MIPICPVAIGSRNYVAVETGAPAPSISPSVIGLKGRYQLMPPLGLCRSSSIRISKGALSPDARVPAYYVFYKTLA